MLFKTITSVALLVAPAFTSPVETAARGIYATQDFPTLTKAFDAIIGKIDTMKGLVDAFDGDEKKMAPMVEAADSLSKELQAQTQNLKKSPAMGIADVLTILDPVGKMQGKVEEIVSALTSKKEVFDKSNTTPVVVQQLQQQRQDANALAKAITGNLPLASIIGPIAAPIAKQFTDRLEAGIKSFGAEPEPLKDVPASAPSGGKSPGGAAPKSGGKGKGGKGPALYRDVSIDELVI
jgi:hydrophobic surface binding protein A